MPSNKWNSQRNRKSPVSAKRPGPRLGVEALEDRCVPAVTGYRPIDEVGNNEADPNLGIANTDLLRISPADYKPVANGGDGLNTPSLTYGAPTFIAGPRLVSNVVSNQATTLFGSTDINTVSGNGLSDFGYTWGQFIDHDMDLTPTQSDPQPPAPNTNKDGANGFPIPKDPTHPTDPIGQDPNSANTTLAFTRSVFDPTTGITTPREQINVSTSFLDLSQVYGSTAFVADALRTHSGGLLKSSPGANGIVGDGDDLLPFNTTAALSYNGNQPYFTQAQLDMFGMANDAHLVDPTALFVAGDPRANETTELTSLQTLFMRNHNRLATALYASHPDWDDGQLYQEARKLNIAMEQSITYYGYLPALLGPTAMPTYQGYDSTVDPSIATEFSTLAFRFGHSQLNNDVPRDADDGSSVGAIPLAVSFFNPTLLTPGGVDFMGNAATDIGAVLKGDADNNAQAVDVIAVSAVRNLLFGQGGQGEDLIARDMWRVDDHGIGDLNMVRAAYAGVAAELGIDLSPIVDTGVSGPGEPFRFHGFETLSSDPAVVQNLITAFTGPSRDTVPGFLSTGHFAGNIHPFIAGLAEDHVPGSELGPLFHTILVDQFTRLRDGDRFFYQNESLNAEELMLIGQGSTLAKVIKANTGITQLQDDVFRFLEQQDGKTKGYYTNNNGQTELTGSAHGNTLLSTISSGLIAALANPDQAGKTVLVDRFGNYVSASSLQSYSFVKNFLQNVSDDNVANKLSVQLLTTEFNILLGKVDATTSIYVPAITLPPGSDDDMGANRQQELQDRGVSNPSGIAKVQDLISAAIGSLRLAPDTADPGDPDRLFQRALKGCFVAINNNERIFILS